MGIEMCFSFGHTYYVEEPKIIQSILSWLKSRQEKVGIS